MAKKLTTEEFIKRAKAVHGDKYGYDEAVYVNKRTKVVITCKKHGAFLQLPLSHVNGLNCRACSYEEASKTKSLTTSEFITKSKLKHGERYNYDKVEYAGTYSPVVVTCVEHGDFAQSPNSHLSGSGCPTCAIKEAATASTLSTKQFITKSKAVHADKYTYELTKYVKSKYKVVITCQTHGDFEQTPAAHLSGRGCVKCANSKKGMSVVLDTQQFIVLAKTVHGSKYDYRLTNYIRSKQKVSITCSKHGEFKQKPNDHLNGQGCPKCGTVVSKGHAEVGAFLESILNG
jgi:hypothetical protein